MTAYRREQTGFPHASARSSITPRRTPPVASPHRSGHWAGIHGEDMPSTTGSYAQQLPDEENDEQEEDGPYDQMRIGSSAIRWQARTAPVPVPVRGRAQAVVIHRRASVPARATAATQRRISIGQTVPDEQEQEDNRDVWVSSARRRRGTRHWLLFVGVGMLCMLLLWVGLSHLMQWWQMQQDDWTYGRPRTFQLDAVVGHHDSATNPTHFIVVNLNGHIDLIELPGGDPSRARLYSGPVLLGPGADLTPVTLSIADVNGDGKPDLIVHVQGEAVVYLNDGTGFRSLAPGEQVHLP